MKKRSFFFKEYLTHFILIVVAFALAGSVFYHQMASYALRAKQTELKTTVQSLAEQSKVMQGTDSDVIRELYMLSIARIAKEDELTVLVTNESGEVQMAAHPNGSTYSVSGYRVPAEVVSELTRSGSYAAVGSVGVLTEATSYTVGSCVRDSDGNVAALIFVSCEDPATAGVVRHSTQTLVLILLVTLAAMLIISFILSQHITRPIKNIAAAAKEFASGNFDVRVPEDNHCYEIDELAVSFNNMASDLDQLEELTRGFISNVSHEFKTPMTTIGGFVDGMIDGTIPEEQRDKYLRIIAEETRRLSRMVNRMLDAAKIQSGELLLSPAPFDFSAMTSQIILSFEQKIEKKKLEVECELDDRLIVMGDRDHLYRAVYNLVDNARATSVRSPSRTPAQAFPPRICRTCSTASTRRIVRVRWTRPAQASVCTSSRISSTCTAERSPSARTAARPNSSLRFRSRRYKKDCRETDVSPTICVLTSQNTDVRKFPCGNFLPLKV